jgi:hypothetical protein
MGRFFVKEFAERQIFCLSSVSLFDLKARFFVPTRGSLTSSRAGAVKVGRRANLAACSELARPYLDSFEHDGTLGAIGMTIRGEPACGRGSVAPQPCIRWVQRTRTMMQSYASAAKLRSGGPILLFGVESQGNTSGLRHLEPSSATLSPAGTGAETVGCPSVTSVHLCRPQNDAVRDHALPHETPQGDQ